MPSGHSSKSHGSGDADATTAATISVAVGVGLGVAALAGGAALASAALGTGINTATSTWPTKNTDRSRHGSYMWRNGKSRYVKKALKCKDIEWDMEGRILNWKKVLKISSQGGVAPELRAQLWPFLLGVFPEDSTIKEREIELRRLRNLYTKLVLVCQELDIDVQASKKENSANNPRKVQGVDDNSIEKPSALPRNLAAFAESHRIIVMDAVRTDLRTYEVRSPAKNNLEDISKFMSLSKEQNCNGRKTFVNMTDTSGTLNQATALSTVSVLPVSVSDGIPELMLVDPPCPGPSEAVASGQLPLWRSDLAASTIDGATHLTPNARRLMMRMVNILSAYAVHDPESGYCQGMSDLAAAFVQLIDDDALAFACFERLMRQARQNFRHDELGIQSQLNQVSRIISDTDPKLFKKLNSLGISDCMFTYRMVLVMMRRELPLHETLTLWEAKWATETLALLKDEENKFNDISNISKRTSSVLNNENNEKNFGNSINSGKEKNAAVLRKTSYELPANVLSPMRSSSGSSTSFAATLASMDAAVKSAVIGADRTSSENTTKEDKITANVCLGASGAGWKLPSRSDNVGTLCGPILSQNRRGALTSPDFILHFVVAVVRSQRPKILTECRDSDDVLRLFNSLDIDFWTALAHARKLFKAYKQGSAVLDRL